MSSSQKNSTELAFVNPQAHDQKFVVNGNVRDLETLRKTFKQERPSVLGKVRNFLPKLAAANEDTNRQLETDPMSVNVENVKEGETHVEMNIAVMEQLYDSDSTDTSDSDDDTPVGEVTEDNLRMPKQHRQSDKVLIECCASSDEKSKDEDSLNRNMDIDEDKT